ncbi:unnamed protein product [Amoebophrya sp. A120]|nr:unnamed protein product [Amoebophrya sp. A120]|eukprot:GSA120T00001242001.1
MSLSTTAPRVNAALGQVLFRQLFEKESSTYTYLLGAANGEAVLIDPVLETVERDLKLVEELGLVLKYAVNTHCHADHVTGTGKIKEKLGGVVRTAIGEHAESKADILLKDGDKLELGGASGVEGGALSLTAVHTPGHTGGCLTYVLNEGTMAFTGDTLLIRGCGRTDFQSGSAKTLFRSVREKIFGRLPDSCVLYPAHDYQGRTSTTVWEEKKFNPRLGLEKTEAQFVDIMDNLNLPYPKKIDQAVPANQVCGVFSESN